jgi:hypothetical protein
VRHPKSTLIFLLLGLTATVVAVSLVLMLLLPTLIRRFACEPYGIRCTAGRATIHPHLNLTFDFAVHNLAVFEENERDVVLRTKRLAATLDLRALFRAGQLIPTEIRIERPELLLKQLDDGRWNALALVETVRGRLQPTRRVSPIQLPRIALGGGEIRFGMRRVTDLELELDPKPAPLLLAIQALATIEGRTITARGVVSESFEGELLVQAKEVLLHGATRPWTPRATMRFRLDPTARTFAVSEWIVEDDGGIARGTAAIRFATSPVAYELTVATWQADLAALAAKLPLHPRSTVTGRVDGATFTLKGRWPQLPVARVAATVTGIGLQLPHRSFGVTELGGIIRLEHERELARLRVELLGKSVELFGHRHARPRLRAAITADSRSGDVSVE